MADEMVDIVQAIDLAMQEEKDAVQFYGDAKRKVTNERAVAMLDQLVRFERYHYEKLYDLKKSLEEEGKYIVYEGIEFILPESTVKSSEPVANKEDILEILKIAIGNEERARNKYQELASRTEIPEGKAMFTRLAHEEDGHWRILNDEYYHITNEGLWGI